jgi:VCBS repeat protein
MIAQTGNPIIQPGLIDVSCSKNLAQTVGTLVKKSSLPGSNVDCAIAKVVLGIVRADGAILEIDTISNATVGAFINEAVKKSGRTTGLTHSSVSGLNATISVAYDNECAGGTAFTKTFTGQIMIANAGKNFLNSGDSGSLMVEDVATKPHAVGLLFAGSSTDAIANPIGQVLAFLGATMVSGGPNWSDFDGDGRTDLSVFRNGSWYVLKSSNNTLITRAFGVSTDKIAPADYDGDGKTDFAVFRNGFWYISQSSNGQLRTVQLGGSGDLPIPGDFDGDGKADIAVFHPSNGTWHYIKSGNGQNIAAQFGANGDVPLLGDFDGDGKSDLAVFRLATGYWFYRRSRDGQLRSIHFGTSSDIPVPGDYDGDSVSDIAIFRPYTGVWYRLNSSNGVIVSAQCGTNGDKPVPADYDNDGKTDLAIYRGATWYVRRSADNSVLTRDFGLGTGCSRARCIPATVDEIWELTVGFPRGTDTRLVRPATHLFRDWYSTARTRPRFQSGDVSPHANDQSRIPKPPQLILDFRCPIDSMQCPFAVTGDELFSLYRRCACVRTAIYRHYFGAGAGPVLEVC